MSCICIIGTSNIKHISLISLYTRFFDENHVSYDIIYIDRYGIEEKTNAENQYRFQADNIDGNIKKVIKLLGFRKYTKKIIKRNHYDLLITWQTTAAYLLADYLLKRYKGKYIVNIRDYVIENNFVFRQIIKRLINKSAMNTISSAGFLKFLPNGDYIRVNSINDDLLLDNKKNKAENRTNPFIIGFAGNCRYFKENIKLINSLANDERFELWYCGTNSIILSDYAKTHNILNVKTMPAFNPCETIDIFSRFDMVNSVFGNDAIDNSTLIPIRLYTSISMHIPILVSDRTQLAEEVECADVGFIIKDYMNLGDKLNNYLFNLDKEHFYSHCEEYINTAREQNKVFYAKLRMLLGKML